MLPRLLIATLAASALLAGTASAAATRHSREMVAHRYRRVGVGVARGTPAEPEGPGVTYTADFSS